MAEGRRRLLLLKSKILRPHWWGTAVHGLSSGQAVSERERQAAVDEFGMKESQCKSLMKLVTQLEADRGSTLQDLEQLEEDKVIVLFHVADCW